MAHLNGRQLGTLLAALRMWQCDVVEQKLYSAIPLKFNDIATDGGKEDPLDAEEIDSLCEEINSIPCSVEIAPGHSPGSGLVRFVIDPERISSDDGSKGLELYVPGFAHDAGANDESGSQVYLEIINGEFAVHVWNGGESPAVSVPIPKLKASEKSKQKSLADSE